MDHSPRRRWFRFSLLTLFVLVTMAAVWLGWSLNWVRQRHEFLRERQRFVLDTDPETSTPAPISLRLFGEEGAEFVSLLTEEEGAHAKAKRSVPETIVLGKYTVFSWHRWFRDRATRH